MIRDVDLTEDNLFSNMSKRYNADNSALYPYSLKKKRRIPWRKPLYEDPLFNTSNEKFTLSYTSSVTDYSNLFFSNTFTSSDIGITYTYDTSTSSQTKRNFKIMPDKLNAVLNYYVDSSDNDRKSFKTVNGDVFYTGKVSDIRGKEKHTQSIKSKMLTRICLWCGNRYRVYPWSSNSCCDKCCKKKINEDKTKNTMRLIKTSHNKTHLHNEWLTFKHFQSVFDVYDEEKERKERLLMLLDIQKNGTQWWSVVSYDKLPYVYYKGIDKTRVGYRPFRLRRGLIEAFTTTRDQAEEKDWKDLVREQSDISN